jgi:hypothetical protein
VLDADRLLALEVTNVDAAPSLVITNPNGGPCPAGFACLYQNANRGGFGVGTSSGTTISNLQSIRCPQCTNGIHGVDGTFNDDMTSWHNSTARRYCWGVNATRTPTSHTMCPGCVVNVLPNENDTASSLGPC